MEDDSVYFGTGRFLTTPCHENSVRAANMWEDIWEERTGPESSVDRRESGQQKGTITTNNPHTTITHLTIFLTPTATGGCRQKSKFFFRPPLLPFVCVYTCDLKLKGNWRLLIDFWLEHVLFRLVMVTVEHLIIWSRDVLATNTTAFTENIYDASFNKNSHTSVNTTLA